ncbi:hypothetical protein ABEB36_005063 [Hypothenemus hampei]|uniref:BRISC and BRCA1-A complex member 1 n=1 Tax=Hypothenemus hampei TaxID=57062 RepID=A0ABD1EWU7_HYPHA
MAERVIPIVIEENANSDSSIQTWELSQSEEKIHASSNTPEQPDSEKIPSQTNIKKIRIKPAPLLPKVELEYLKPFDVIEKRNGTTIESEYSLPNEDVIERIILVIDRVQDENYTPFVLGNQTFTPLNMVKKAISIFIKLKLGINHKHEFAIIVMNNNKASVLMEFTNNPKQLVDALNRISECETEDVFDLNTIFDLIETAELPEPVDSGLAPPFLLRTVIFYGRSYTIPKLTLNEGLERLLNNKNFVCDVLMTHEPLETSNNCQKIFDHLQNLDPKGYGYFFPVCRDYKRMFKYTGKLLAHPFQRPIQKLLKN